MFTYNINQQVHIHKYADIYKFALFLLFSN